MGPPGALDEELAKRGGNPIAGRSAAIHSMVGNDVAFGAVLDAADRQHRRLAWWCTAGNYDFANRITVIAASTTGSTVACGIDPWPPLP